MARLHNMPSEHIIEALKGVVDFYFWKGIPCARAWPRPIQKTAAWQATADNMKQVAVWWKNLYKYDHLAWRRLSNSRFQSSYDCFKVAAARMNVQRQVVNLRWITEYSTYWDISFYFREGTFQKIVYLHSDCTKPEDYQKNIKKVRNEKTWIYKRPIKGYLKDSKKMAPSKTIGKVAHYYVPKDSSKTYLYYYIENEHIEENFSTGIFRLKKL